MERIIGGVLGTAAFAAVVVAGIRAGTPFASCALRACAAMVLGYLVGAIVFGPVGLAIVKEAAGPVPPPPSVPAGPQEAKKETPAPPQAT